MLSNSFRYYPCDLINPSSQVECVLMKKFYRFMMNYNF